MKNLFIALVAACMVVVCRAALPPGVADEAKANADQVVLIRVNSADLVVGNDNEETTSCKPDFIVDATTIAVNQTTSGLTSGDTLTFNSYIVDRESVSCEGFVGPKSPPKLEAGWCGYVYLNNGAGDGSNNMELAAWGHSFVPAPEGACDGIEPADTSTAANNDADDVDTDTNQESIEEDETSQYSSHATRASAILTAACASVGLFMM